MTRVNFMRLSCKRLEAQVLCTLDFQANTVADKPPRVIWIAHSPGGRSSLEAGNAASITLTDIGLGGRDFVGRQIAVAPMHVVTMQDAALIVPLCFFSLSEDFL